MPQTARNTRIRLYASLGVLAAVLAAATFLQFYGSQTRSRTEAASKPPIQSRAVFGIDKPSAPSPVSEAASDALSVQIPGESAGETTAREEIDGFLNRWRNAQITKNVDGQTNLYAPVVAQYFTQRKVSRARVRREIAQFRDLYPNIVRYDISDVTVEYLRGDRATVTFRKDWDLRGARVFTGAERQRLKLRKLMGDWKIVSEEELKVYWSKRT